MSVLHYLKYFLFHAFGLLAAISLLAGGPYITGGLVALLAVYLLGDAVCGDDISTPKFEYPRILTVQLWLALPLLSLIVFSSVWSVCSGDPLGFGVSITQWSGYDVIAARDATAFGHHISAVIITGLMIGMIGTITAHELTHRTWDPVSMFIGRWLLAFTRYSRLNMCTATTVMCLQRKIRRRRRVGAMCIPTSSPRQ